MRSILTSLAELVGGVCLVAAAFMVGPVAGVAALGLLLIAAGVLLA